MRYNSVMSYHSLIMQDDPRHFFPLVSGASAFSDYSGGTTVDVFGVPALATSLVAGGNESYNLSDTNHFRFISNVFNTEPVSKPFTLEAWFKPVKVNGNATIVGHRDNGDGLVFDGETIKFSTHHGLAGDVVASYRPPHADRSFHVVGVHTANKNELYVDGVLVGSASLTDEHLLYGYEVTVFSGYLYSGNGSTNTGSIIIDGVAAYDTALPSRQVKLHFLWGRDATDFRSVVQSNQGVFWNLDVSGMPLSESKAFYLDEQWLAGNSGSVSVENGVVKARLGTDGLTVAGTWQSGHTFGDLDAALAGSRIDWDYDGSIVVETSLDGTNWSVATNGQQIPGVAEGFTTANKSLDVRVTFPAGEVDGDTVLRSLSLVFYRSRVIPSPNSTTNLILKGNSTLSNRVLHPLEHDSRAGANLYNGYASIDGDTNFRTIEMWVTLQSLPGSNARLMDARTALTSTVLWTGTAWSLTGATVYVNGAVVTGPQMSLLPDVPNHVVIIPSADITDATIGASYTGNEGLPMTLSALNTYSSVFTAAQVTTLYKSYFGPEILLVNDTDNLGISDTSTNTVKLYSKNWSVVGSG